jgi:VWFA-related protein
MISVPVHFRVVALNLRVATAAALMFYAVVQLSAGQRDSPDVPQAQPTFRAEVNSVDVDVTVTDSQGNFVRDLVRADFEVLEDGKLQKISTFGIVELPTQAAPVLSSPSSVQVEPDIRSNAAESEGRVFVIVLDDLHTHPLRSARVKDAARRFIERAAPQDRISVVHTSGASNASQEFTQSRVLLLSSVEKFVGRKLRSSVLERLEALQRQQDTPTQADIRMQHVFDPLDAERARQAENMLATLQNIGNMLSDVRGRRKSVVLFSEGLDYDILNGVAQTKSGVSTFTSGDAPTVMNRLRLAIGAMTRSNISVYSIDPRGLATGGDEAIEVGFTPQNPFLGLGATAIQNELRQAQASLRALSEETGGVASLTSNDLSAPFARILRDNSLYYLLSYESNNTRRDGRFRKIDVRVRRPSLQVRARSGYLGLSPRDTTTDASIPGPEPAVLRQLLFSALPVSGLPLRVFAAPFKGEGASGSAFVGVEVDARTLRFRQQHGFYTNQLEAVVVAIDPEGKFVDRDWQSIQLRLSPATHKIVQAEGIRVLFRLDLPSGRYQLRAAAYEAESGTRGSVHYDVDVPDFGRAPLSMSGLVLTSTRAAAIPTPMTDLELATLLREQPPTASRQFTTAETLGVAFIVYQQRQKALGTVDVATTVTDGSGHIRFESATEISSDELRRARDGSRHILQIPLADIPPGTYVLGVRATSRLSADLAVTRELPFQVSGHVVR